jgi:NAD(P)H-flavin reductase
MQLTPYLEFNNNNQFDNEKCIRCSTCIVNCPAKILSLSSKEESCRFINETDIISCKDRKNIKAKIINIKELTDNIIEYTFKFISPNTVSYKAGQFILINIQDNPYMNRAYSISSFNEDDSALSITVKNMANGYGTQLMYKTFKIGDYVELQGPMGNELVVDKTAEKILLLATGIGITPFLPIVKDIIENPKNIKNVKLVYGASYERDFIYDDEFTKISCDNNIFEYIKVTSRDKNFKGAHGRITDVIKDIDLNDYKIYICGSESVVKSIIEFLCDFGANRINIFAEGN